MENEIRYADLFGGVGGFRKGINNSGTNAKCVFYCDIDKYSVQTYNKNFGENHEPTDITKIRESNIPEIDMLCGGFPCQAFSIAGKRRGFEDTRGTLFFEIARIIKAKRPKTVFLENVKGLLNHNKGQTFRTIIQTLSELGYDVQWMVLNSKFFGVPQNRERVFIIGSLRGECRPEILPFRQTSKQSDERNPEKQTASSLQHPGHSGGNYKGMNMVKSERFPLKYPNRNQKNIEGDYTFTIDSCHTGGIKETRVNKTVRTGGRGSLTKKHTWDIVNDKSKIRRLTPIECERLQGFPDNWTEGVSDTQRYKQMGNAVTVNVIEAIARKLITQNTQEMN